jgi:hypothetical protein
MGASEDTQEHQEYAISLAQQGYSTAEIVSLTGIAFHKVKKWTAGHHNHEARKLRKEKAAFDAALRRPADPNRPLPPGAVKAGGHIWLKLEGWGAR